MPPPKPSTVPTKPRRVAKDTSSSFSAFLPASMAMSLKPPQLYELHAKDLPSLYSDSPAGLRGRSLERSHLVTLDKGNLEKKHQYDSAVQDWNDGKAANRPVPPVWHTYNPKDRAINFWKCVALEQYEEQQKSALEDAGITTKAANTHTNDISSGAPRTNAVPTNVTTSSAPSSDTNVAAAGPLPVQGNANGTPTVFASLSTEPTSNPRGIVGNTAAPAPEEIAPDEANSSASSTTLIGDTISVDTTPFKDSDELNGHEDPVGGYNTDATEDAPYAPNYTNASPHTKKRSTAPTTKNASAAVDGVVANSTPIVSNAASTPPAGDKPSATSLKEERSPVAAKNTPTDGGGNTVFSDSKDNKSTPGSITLRLRQIVESDLVDNKNNNSAKDDKCSGCDSPDCSCNDEGNAGDSGCEDPGCPCHDEGSSSEDEDVCSGCHDHECPCSEDCSSEYPCDDPYCPNLEGKCDGCDDPDCDCNNCEGCDDPECYCNYCEDCDESPCICDDDRSSAMYDSDAGCDGCSDMDCDCTKTDESDDEEESDASDEDDPMNGSSDQDSNEKIATSTELPKQDTNSKAPSLSGTKTGKKSSGPTKKEASSPPIIVPMTPERIKAAKTGNKRSRSDEDQDTNPHNDHDAPRSESSSPIVTSKRRRLTSEDTAASGSVNKDNDAANVIPELLEKVTGIDEKLDRLTTAMDAISKKVDKGSEDLKSTHEQMEGLEETINVTNEHASHTLHHVNLFHEVVMEEVKKVQKKLKRNMKY